MVTTRSVAAVLVVGAAGLAAAALTTRDSTHRVSAGSSSASSRTGPTTPAATHRPPASSRSRTPAPFTLVVTTRSGRISTGVDPISVASNEPVDPPHGTAAQWNTAVWVQQSTYPSTPARGTTYVYGHACHYHVCAFTHLHDARPGDPVRITTATRTSTYTIERTGLSPKSARSLPAWASDSTVPNRLVLVTCAFEQGDTSTSNIVVVAHLV